MGLFDFFKKKSEPPKNNTPPPALSDREKYGQAWQQIVFYNKAKGLQTMKELSESGFLEATIVLAMFSDSESERKTLYKKAADLNHPEGLWGYAAQMQHSFIPDPDNPADVEWEATCLKAAEMGSVDAMNEMGNIFNRRQDYAQSMYWYTLANINDHPAGGVGVAGIAKKWLAAGMPRVFNESAHFNLAQYKCAIFYLEMWAGQQTTTPINELITMTLDGEPLAAYLTGDIFENAGNTEMAYKMYNAIAFENDPHGLKCYGDMLYRGIGVEKDIQGALRAFTLAAEGGDRAAMFAVGQMTQYNNRNLAAYWFGVAHTRGYQPALLALRQLAQR